MRKIVLIPTLFTIGFAPITSLVSCGDKKGETIEAYITDRRLVLSNSEQTKDHDYQSYIQFADGYNDGNWIIPTNRAYYEVFVDKQQISNYDIQPYDPGEQFCQKAIITIPKEELVNAKYISIGVEPYCKYLTLKTYNKSVSFQITRLGAVDGELDNMWYTSNLSDPDGWQKLTADQRIELPPDTPIYLWNKDHHFSNNEIYYKFSFNGMTGSAYDVSGNIMSLLNFGSLEPYSFYNCFIGTGFNVDQLEIESIYLPETQLAESCYEGMFSSLANYDEAPILPADNNGLAINCYKNMFNCAADLDYIKVGFGTEGSTAWPSLSFSDNWIVEDGVMSDFVWKGSIDGPTERGSSTIPSGWDISTWK